MKPAGRSLEDPERLDTLKRVGLHDELRRSIIDPAFERLARLGNALLGVPLTLVSIVEPDRQFFAGAAGLDGAIVVSRETPLSHSYCRHVVEQGTPLVIEDAREHPLTAESPAIRDNNAIAYAGIPLAAPNGMILGTLCAVDHRPREWSLPDLAVLRDLADLATTEIELRYNAAAERHDVAEQFKVAFEQAAVGMAHIALDGRLLEANDAFVHISGYASTELGEMRLQDLDAGTDPQETEQPRVTGSEDQSIAFVGRWRSKSGAIRVVNVSLTTISDVTGGNAYLLATVEDITATRAASRRAAMQQSVSGILAESDSLHDVGTRILETVAWAGGWDYAALWCVISADELERLYAWTRPGAPETGYMAVGDSLRVGQGIPGTVWEFGDSEWVTSLPPADGDANGRTSENGPRTVCACAIRSETGIRGVLELASTEVREPEWELVRAVEDVSRQIGQFMEVRRAEEVSSRIAGQFRAVFEGAAIGIAIVNLDGRIADVNPSLQRMVGRSADELRQMSHLDLLHPDDVSAAGIIFDQLVAGAIPQFRMEERCRRPDDSVVWVRVTGSLVSTRDTTGNFVVLMKEDVSAQREAEAALAVRDEELRQSQKMDAIGQLAGGIAHDFNNLLTVIIAYGGLLQSELEPESSVRADLEEMITASHRAADLTRQLLAFSRKQVLQPRPLELREIVADTEKMLQRVIGEDVELRTELDARPCPVLGDPGQLGQVLLNLAVNARDAMPAGGSLSITVRNVDVSESYAVRHEGVTAGPHVMLAVTDTGQGMDRETQTRVFEPFFTTKETGKGTGLGLSTVYGIVKQSGGHIWLYSELGRGTTFKVFLPRSDSPVREAPIQPRAAEADGAETILLVEDEAPVRAVVKRILERAPYRVIESPSSVRATEVAAAHQGPIHLLLTDVVMPGLNGREVAERLQNVRPGVPVLFITGYTDTEIASRGLLSEEIAFLQKPFDARALLRKVREVLDSAKLRPPARIGSRASIAVVDDMATNRLSLRTMLGEHYEVTEFSSGEALLESLSRSIPDAIVLDIALPGVDGVTVMMEIRQREALHGLPVFAWTGHETIGSRERFLNAGFTDIIPKPVVDQSSLFSTLATHVRSR